MIQVTDVKPHDNHILRVTLSDGRTGDFDVSPYLDKGIFIELKDLEYFRMVSVFLGAVCWSHGQDFGPDTIDVRMKELVA